MDIRELKEKPTEELKSLLQDKQAELTNIRFNISAHQERNYQALKEVKRDIARIMTLLKKPTREI